MTLRKISGKCYSNQAIRLDGYAYVDCFFDSCRFVYMGKKGFSLVGNRISSDCILDFRDRADETIKALREVYELGDWGRKHALAIVAQVAELTEIPTKNVRH